ncbi:MAG: hypothetical protein ACXWIU_08170, partial [Limisphaerales bacterium]
MKTKGTATRKYSADNPHIFCPKCGNDEFKRSLSEIDSIVRFKSIKNGEAIEEIVLHEGVVE